MGISISQFWHSCFLREHFNFALTNKKIFNFSTKHENSIKHLTSPYNHARTWIVLPIQNLNILLWNVKRMWKIKLYIYSTGPLNTCNCKVGKKLHAIWIWKKQLFHLTQHAYRTRDIFWQFSLWHTRIYTPIIK